MDSPNVVFLEQDEEFKAELTQRLFGQTTLPLDVGQEVDEGAECRAELTQRLFGKETLGMGVVDEVEQLKAELTQRLFGAEQSILEWGSAELSADSAMSAPQGGQGDVAGVVCGVLDWSAPGLAFFELASLDWASEAGLAKYALV